MWEHQYQCRFWFDKWREKMEQSTMVLHIEFFPHNTMGFSIEGNPLSHSGFTYTCLISIWAGFYSDKKPLIEVVSQFEQFEQFWVRDPSYWIHISFGIPYTKQTSVSSFTLKIFYCQLKSTENNFKIVSLLVCFIWKY